MLTVQSGHPRPLRLWGILLVKEGLYHSPPEARIQEKLCLLRGVDVWEKISKVSNPT